MKNVKSLFVVLFGLMSMLTWAVEHHYQRTETAANYTSSTLSFKDPYYNHVNGACSPTTNNYADDFYYERERGMVAFQVFHGVGDAILPSGTYPISANVKVWDKFGSVIHNGIDNFEVTYDPDGSVNYQGVDSKVYLGAHKIEVSNINLGSASSQIQVRIVFDYERMTDYANVFGCSFSGWTNSVTINTTSSERTATFSWSDSPRGNEFYEIEYAWVYDEPDSAETFDFNKNSTRVRIQDTMPLTNQNHSYTIPLVFDNGFLIWRIRKGGWKVSNTSQEPKFFSYGAWSIAANSGLVSDLIDGEEYTEINSTDAHEPDINWQYAGTLAENGKRSDQISYADGTQRVRQVVQTNNLSTSSNEGDGVLVTEMYYDWFGREAASSLPAPANIANPERSLNYRDQFNRPTSNPSIPYDHRSFSVVDPQNCAVMFDGMSNQSGAGRYYSSANPLTDAHVYLPDAEEYPFVQKKYTPDQTGRIRRMGAAGDALQVFGGRDTEFFYSVPSQEELDILFGNDIGVRSHYRKKVTRDPNGQLAVEYVDLKGNVIATALAGDSPTNLDPLPSNGVNATQLTVDLLDGLPVEQPNQILAGEYVHTMPFVVESEQNETFTYKFVPQVFEFVCPVELFNCVSCQYELEIRLIDDCGEIYTQSTTISSNDCPEPATTHFSLTFTRTLPPGEYRMEKILRVDKDHLWEKAYEAAECNSTAFYNQIFQQIYTEAMLNDPCGTVDCADWDPSVIDTAHYNLPGVDPGRYEEDTSRFDCGYNDPCLSMYYDLLADIQPGTAVFDDIFDTINWKHTSYKYFDVNDSIMMVDIELDSIGPTPSSNTYLPNATGVDSTHHQHGTTYRVPIHMLDNLSDFIKYWRPEWAELFIESHPEIDCYVNCINHARDVALDNYVIRNMSYDEAVLNGYYDEGSQSLTSAILNAFQTNFPTSVGSTSFSIELGQYLSDTSIVGGVVFDSYSVLALSMLYNGNPPQGALANCSGRELWPALKQLLISERMIYFYSKWEVCDRVPGLDDFFPDPPATGVMDYLNGTSTTYNSTQAVANGVTACQTGCNERAEGWELLLAECISDTVTLNNILEDLIAICECACEENPMGASSVSAVQDSIYNCGLTRYSFEKVFDLHGVSCPFTISEITQSADRGDILVTQNAQTPDNCTCDFLNEIKDYWNITLDGGAGIEQASAIQDYESYLAQYGLTPEMVEQLDCRCEILELPDGSYSNDSTLIASVFGDETILVPQNLTCGPCVLCNDVMDALSFHSTQTGLDLYHGDVVNLAIDDLYEGFNYYYTQDQLRDFLWSCVQGDTCYASGRCTEDMFTLQSYINDLLRNECLEIGVMYPLDVLPYVDFWDPIHALINDLNKVSNPPSVNGDAMQFNIVNQNGSWFLEWVIYDDYKLGVISCTIYIPIQDFVDPNKPITRPIEGIVCFESWEYDFESCGWRAVASIETNYGRGLVDKGLFSASCFDFPCIDPEESMCPGISTTLPIDPCQSEVQNQAAAAAWNLTALWIEQEAEMYYNEFLTTCMTNLDETFTRKYQYDLHHFTLYYYDRVGNLKKTVPPEGVSLVSVTNLQNVNIFRHTGGGGPIFPNHTMETEYNYDSYNMLISQSTPDAGSSEFFFDRMGRIVASQRAQQDIENVYSYSIYDYGERVLEAGEAAETPTLTEPVAQDPFLFRNWLFSGSRNEVTRTYYDHAISTGASTHFLNGQQQLRNRVATTAYFESYDPLNHNLTDAQSLAHYSYDVHGNVVEYLTEIPELSQIGNNHFKLLTYDFDLLSGNVNKVVYQPGDLRDHFEHRYAYDNNNRLIAAYSSTNGILWERDARYSYYRHGPLMRTELGQERVQGLDYAYTINGWLKAINGVGIGTPSAEMGVDGQNGGLRENVARDAYAFSLRYFTGDYNPVGAGATDIKVAATAQSRNLYNGNIGNMSSALRDDSEGILTTYNRTFRYDQLNRLTQSYMYDGTTNHASTAHTYDANGNIETLNRYDLSGGMFDQFNYNYNPGNNQLNYVFDNISASAYANDLENGQNAFNYQYDADGNLISDAQEGINSITWNVQGKVSKIDKAAGPDLEFRYDPMGQRQVKVVKNTSQETGWTKNYYIRDPQGNVMATYAVDYIVIDSVKKEYKQLFSLNEQHVYGSSRLGVLNVNEKLYSAELFNLDFYSDGSLAYYERKNEIHLTDTMIYITIRGDKSYKLTNHLGNVMSTISDRKVPVNDASNNITYFLPDVDTYQDYFPFGMVMSERSGSEMNAGYRFGFNGMEYENELYQPGNAYDFGARVYEGRIGRWFGTDNYEVLYPAVSTYSSFLNNPILNIDIDGNFVLEGSAEEKELLQRFVDAAYKALSSNPYLLDRFLFHSGLTRGEMEQIFKDGEGPILKFSIMKDNAYLNSKFKNTSGYFSGKVSGQEWSVLINEDFFNEIYSSNVYKSFFITMTILHELVHFGDKKDGEDGNLDYKGLIGDSFFNLVFEATYDLYSGHESYERLSQGIEAGLAFEMDVAEYNVDDNEFLKTRYNLFSSRTRKYENGSLENRTNINKSMDIEFETPKNKLILGSEGQKN